MKLLTCLDCSKAYSTQPIEAVFCSALCRANWWVRRRWQKTRTRTAQPCRCIECHSRRKRHDDQT